MRRIAAAPDGLRDATQFDVAIDPTGGRVAWVETRVNAVSARARPTPRRASSTRRCASRIRRTETNGACGRTVAKDPNGRHLRHPTVSANGRLLAATAYASGEERDLAIDGTGAIAVFSTAGGALVRDVVPRGAGSPSFSPDGREIGTQPPWGREEGANVARWGL